MKNVPDESESDMISMLIEHTIRGVDGRWQLDSPRNTLPYSGTVSMYCRVMKSGFNDIFQKILDRNISPHVANNILMNRMDSIRERMFSLNRKDHSEWLKIIVGEMGFDSNDRKNISRIKKIIEKSREYENPLMANTVIIRKKTPVWGVDVIEKIEKEAERNNVPKKDVFNHPDLSRVLSGNVSRYDKIIRRTVCTLKDTKWTLEDAESLRKMHREIDDEIKNTSMSCAIIRKHSCEGCGYAWFDTSIIKPHMCPICGNKMEVK